MTAQNKPGPCAAQAHPSSVGFLLVDSSLNPAYVNAEAVQILTYPEPPTEIAALDKYLSEKIHSLLSEDHHSPRSPQVVEFISGRRQYVCRVLPVTSRSEVPSLATAVLLERGAERSIDVEQATAELPLTAREKETVAHLLLGLTTREIARRMTISPHTVKKHVKHVMIKLGVATRSGVIGKLVRSGAERH